MTKKAIAFRTNKDIETRLESDAKTHGVSVATIINRILKEFYFPKGSQEPKQKPLRAGEALECPIFILPIEPRGAWVDVSVCESCNKEEKNGRPCRSWQTYQSDLRLEKEGILKPKLKSKGEK